MKHIEYLFGNPVSNQDYDKYAKSNYQKIEPKELISSSKNPLISHKK